MAIKVNDRGDSKSGYVPKADATRGSQKLSHPEQAQKIESDQTARGPEPSHEREIDGDADLASQESGKNRGGRYGDGW